MKTLLSLALSLWIATPALAHSPLHATVPQNGETLSAAPQAIMLEFGNDIRLTQVLLSDASGNETTLGLSEYADFTTDFTFAISPLDSGTYTVEWRGLGADGHVLNGEFGFIIE